MGLTRGVAVVAFALGACSSNKSRAVEDARRVTTPGDTAGDAARATEDAGAPVGDVQVRVEWHDVPAAVRRSPGKTPCGRPRAPSVSPSTTWGIGDVLVIVDGAPAPVRDARVRWSDCALEPRLVVGETLVIDSAADRPATLVLQQAATTRELRADLEGAAARTVQLPISGHQVAVTLEEGAVYRLGSRAKGTEPAWIVAGPGAITDPNGVVLVRDVPVGVHAVRAWLPPRGGQPARSAAGEVTVVADDVADLTLELAP